MIGQKGIQGTMTSSGQLQHSEHSPHTLRRGNKAVCDCVVKGLNTVNLSCTVKGNLLMSDESIKM